MCVSPMSHSSNHSEKMPPTCGYLGVLLLLWSFHHLAVFDISINMIRDGLCCFGAKISAPDIQTVT